MERQPIDYTVTLFFGGGPNDEGLEVKAFKAALEPTWPKEALRSGLTLTHHGVGDKQHAGALNWKLEFSLWGDPTVWTADSLSNYILHKLHEQELTQGVRVEVHANWNYG